MIIEIPVVEMCEQSVRTAIRRWVMLLAENKFEEAAEALSRAPGERTFDSKEIRHSIGMYSRRYAESCEAGAPCEDAIPQVSDPLSKLEGKERILVSPDTESKEVVYNLPIEGKWSDLSAVFEFFREGSTYKMGLCDIHVL